MTFWFFLNYTIWYIHSEWHWIFRYWPLAIFCKTSHFSTSQKNFASHIITRESFFWHASRESILFHSFDPSKPTIMHTTIAVVQWFLFAHSIMKFIQHMINQFCIWACWYASRCFHSVKTINNQWQIDFSCRNRKLSDICKHFLIWLIRSKISLDDIFSGRSYFIFIGIILLCSLQFEDRTIFSHDP